MNVAGGVRATESGVDLGVVLAVVGAAYGLPLAPGTVVVGEIGLGGEVRQVTGLERRLQEAARLGFRRGESQGRNVPAAADRKNRAGSRLLGRSGLPASDAVWIIFGLGVPEADATPI